MRIGINCRPLFPGKIGGLEHHFRGLLGALLELDQENEYVLFVHAENEASLAAHASRARLHRLGDPHALTAVATAVRDTAPDVVFHPFLFIEPPTLDCYNAVLIPDVRFARYPEQIPPEILKVWRQKFPESAQRAEVVFTNSRASRADLEQYLRTDPKKIIVTGLGVTDEFFIRRPEPELAALRRKYGLPDKYLYYPADTWPHKNHVRLLGALKQLRQRGLRVALALSGFPNAGEDALQHTIVRLGLQDQVLRLGYLPRTDLPGIYQAATGMIFPSTYEGWGMPVGEALAGGTPVLCSDASSISEAGGDAALYFDPLDETRIAEAIERFMGDAALRADLARRGPEQARTVTWQHAARTTLAGLQTAARPTAVEWVDPLPLVTIVTPSYNQGRFIERTIQSVLSQNYPHLEYLVLDGGSRDETVDILKKYSHRLRWVSRKDRGQSDAINQGLKAANGEILAYLNSDDTYTPGAIRRAVAHLVSHPTCDLVYGNGWHIDDEDRYLEPYPTEPFDAERLASRCFICQPTAFWRRGLHDKIGYFDEEVHFVMDYEFWMRAAKVARIAMLDEYQANSRMWEDNKTLGSRAKHLRQSLDVVHRHYGKVPLHWINAYVDFVISRRHYPPPAKLARRLRAMDRAFLRQRVQARYNGWGEVSAQWVLPGGGAPREGYGDGWMARVLERRLVLTTETRRVRIAGDMPGWPGPQPPHLRVYAEREALGELAVPGIGPFSADFGLPAEIINEKEIRIRLVASRTFIPARHNGGEDDRRLSVRISAITAEA